MDPNSPHYHGPYGQPGLEVVNHPDLEVAMQEHNQTQSLPEVRANEYDNSGKEHIVVTKYPEVSQYSYPEHYPTPVTHYTPPGSAAELANSPTQGPGAGGHKKRLWIVGGIVLAVVVVLAAVLGGVLGSKAAQSSSSSSSGEASASQTGAGGGSGNNAPGGATNTTTGSNSTTTTTPKPQTIRQGSSLSVTGWRNTDGSVGSYLFFQDPQGGVRYSRFNTSHCSGSNSSSCWAAPVSFNSYANSVAPLAASTIIWGDAYEPQIELFYTGYSTHLLGVNFNDQSTPTTGDDSVNKAVVTTGTNSSLTAYWPWTIYQDSAGVLFHVRNLLGGNFSPSGTSWDNNKINITAMTSSSLAIVPMSSNFSRIAIKGGYAVFYQRPDGSLAVSVTDLDSPQLDPTYPLSWPTTLPAVTLPKLAPLAGFSVARAGDALQRVDTYLLYLDADGDINVLFTNSSAASATTGSSSDAKGVVWQTAQPGALKGADKDTDIACLTMATSFWDAAEVGVLLEGASDATRCYFQRGGVVVEVKLSGGVWEVVGTVPIP